MNVCVKNGYLLLAEVPAGLLLHLKVTQTNVCMAIQDKFILSVHN